MIAPALPSTEALSIMLSHFVDCIEQSRTPITDDLAGKRVLSILEAADRSLALSGQPVAVNLEHDVEELSSGAKSPGAEDLL